MLFYGTKKFLSLQRKNIPILHNYTQNYGSESWTRAIFFEKKTWHIAGCRELRTPNKELRKRAWAELNILKTIVLV